MIYLPNLEKRGELIAVMLGTCRRSLEVIIPFLPHIRNSSGEVRFLTINDDQRNTRSVVSSSFVSKNANNEFLKKWEGKM